MSFFDDYVAEGLCCESCGALIDMDEPGFTRLCAGCQRAANAEEARYHQRKKRKVRK